MVPTLYNNIVRGKLPTNSYAAWNSTPRTFPGCLHTNTGSPSRVGDHPEPKTCKNRESSHGNRRSPLYMHGNDHSQTCLIMAGTIARTSGTTKILVIEVLLVGKREPSQEKLALQLGCRGCCPWGWGGEATRCRSMRTKKPSKILNRNHIFISFYTFLWYENCRLYSSHFRDH